MAEHTRRCSLQPWVLRPMPPSTVHKRWPNDKPSSKCVVITHEEILRAPSSLEGRRWLFLKKGQDDFRRGCPSCKDLIIPGSKEAFLPMISRMYQPRDPTKMPKSATLYSSLSQAQQARRAFVKAIEAQISQKHPLALYPNLEDNISEELLLEVLELLDPERKLESTWDYCENGKKRMEIEKSLKSPKLSKDMKMLLEPPRVPGGHPDLLPMRKRRISKELIEAAMRRYIPKGVYDFCKWVQSLGDLDINENMVTDQFGVEFECKPTYTDSCIKKVNLIPVELRYCRKLSRVKQIRFSLQETSFDRRRRKPPDPYKSRWVKIRYGAWYLRPELWKKLVNDEPLIDPKAFVEKPYPPDIIDELYGTIAFKDFIMSKGYSMPAILEKFFFRKGWDYHDVNTPIPRVVRAHELKYADDDDDDEDDDEKEKEKEKERKEREHTFDSMVLHSLAMGFPRGPRRRQRHHCLLRRSLTFSMLPTLLAIPFPPAMAMVMASQVQNNYCQECEAAINNQIHLQLYAAYMYLSMAFYCDREEVALGHFSRFFLWQSHKWTQHAEKLLWIQNQRDSHISLNQIDMSGYHNWHGGFQVMEYAFNLEMTITQSLLELYHLAARKRDTELSEFLKHHCLQQQMDTIEELHSILTNLRNMWALGDTLVQYLFSQLSLRKKEK
ncbi:putative protein FAM47D [Dipodomys spectabilis]|uniref:putative protein FAM47D n=1 Tax=Dipodomys spectabilis TaxID=105255 RepID=UPI001C545A75|nr:putative protein FAM47D [Dipodomys spectabilis]